MVSQRAVSYWGYEGDGMVGFPKMFKPKWIVLVFNPPSSPNHQKLKITMLS